MRTDALDYALPPERIAIEPATPRDAARLLVADRTSGRISHHRVSDLPDVPGGPRPGDVLVFNETKVIPARFEGERAETGGRVEGLFLAAVKLGGWKATSETPHLSAAPPVGSPRPDHADGPERVLDLGRDRASDGQTSEADAWSASLNDGWRLMLESRGRLRPGERIILTDDDELELLDRDADAVWTARLHSPRPTLDLLEAIGAPPLPPYIRKRRGQLQRQGAETASGLDLDDRQRYNTVFAASPGSVAAPTAALHFTHDLLKRLDERGVRRAQVTLHVGLGTFAPVRTERVEDHQIHREWMRVPAPTRRALADARARGGRIIPVGTTTVRALESLPEASVAVDRPSESPEQGSTALQDFVTETGLFIHPGPDGTPFPFRFTDAMMTNFHLPRSTLLALIAALPDVGLERLLQWYRQAIDAEYRFYSYGDAMWIA